MDTNNSLRYILYYIIHIIYIATIYERIVTQLTKIVIKVFFNSDYITKTKYKSTQYNLFVLHEGELYVSLYYF